MLILDRRSFMTLFAAGALLASPLRAMSQETVDTAELHAPGQLGEKALGPASAPVTVVEYASMSCPHCAHFDTATFDDFKLKYVDTGKVRYVFREFPLNAPAFAVAMVARCAPADKYFDVVHTFFRTQNEWLTGADVKAGILDVAKQFGFTEQSLDACLNNEALFKAINAVRDRGSSFGVNATPTFFINGKKYEGALSMDDLDKAIGPLVQN
jgi:protein-disulfide isomerase